MKCGTPYHMIPFLYKNQKIFTNKKLKANA